MQIGYNTATDDKTDLKLLKAHSTDVLNQLKHNIVSVRAAAAALCNHNKFILFSLSSSTRMMIKEEKSPRR